MYAKRLIINAFWVFELLISSNVSVKASNFNDEHQELSKNSSKISILAKEKSIWGIVDTQLDELFNQSPAIVATFDEQYLIRINKVWTDKLGWSEDYLLTTPYMKDVHPDDKPSTIHIVHEGTLKGPVHHFDPQDKFIPDSSMFIYENRRLSSIGEYHNLQWLIFYQTAGPKTSPPVLCIANDITLEKKADQKKLDLQQTLSATKIKSTFVAHMSHEIRTPLNGIIGFIELALEENPSEKVRFYLQNAYKSALLLLDITNNIIDVSRIEAGTLRLENVTFNPTMILQNTINIINQQLENNKIKIKTSIAVLPETLNGDQNRLKQILHNIVSNALKFTSEGKISIKIKGIAHPKNSSLFILQGTVKDTGKGMDMKFIDKLFKPFSQENSSMNQQLNGTGLSLYITKQLCEKMGGTINVLSTPEIGSTFQFKVMLQYPSAVLSTAIEK